jgi:hypothetical protein
MSDFKLPSKSELLSMCRELAKSKSEPDADADHEAWNRQLVITPRMVRDILAANEEL